HFALVVNPLLRCDPAAVRSTWFDRLLNSSVGTPLEAFIFCHCSSYHVNSWRLCALAVALFKEGAPSVASKLLYRAIECSQTPSQRGTLVAIQAALFIAFQDYRSAAEIVDSL